MDFALRQKNIFNRSSKCPICLSFLRQVTTIEGCCHQFCLNCILKKITEEGLRSCPVCDLDLGSAPLEKLSTMKNFGEKGEENNRDSEDDDQAEKAIGRTLSKNEKQKYLAEGSSFNLNVLKSTSENARGKALGKMSDLSRPQMGSGNAAILCTKSHSLEPKHCVATVEDVAFTSKLQTWNESSQNNVSGAIASANPSTVDDKNAKIDKKIGVFWFALVASNKQKNMAPLEQIPSRYLRVRDGNITVSSIKKYLVQKLNLSSEKEVVISMQGRQLRRPTLKVSKLLDLWLHTKTPSETKRAFVGGSAKDFVMTLTYGRKAN